MFQTKNIALSIAFLCLNFIISAQGTVERPSKPIIDTLTFFNWPSIPDWPRTAISNNGQFVLYATHNLPAGKSSLIVQALKDNQK
ncbi:MAG TPA: hypothetical protein VGD22_00935, partial [Sphingobacteriaceae bacterium]